MPITWPDPARPADDVSEAGSDSSDLSYPSSVSSYDSEDHAALIQEEWEESLRQIETVLSVIILPFFGKWYGRRVAFWAYERYKVFGWTRAFLGLGLARA